MPLKKSPAIRPLSVHQQKNKISNSGRKKPAWDDSVNDLTAFRASKDDLLRRKLLHQSANTDLVKEDFLQKKIMQVIKKNSLASKGVFKEVIQNEGDDSVTKSSSTNSHVSFNDSPIKLNKNHTNWSAKEIIGKENRQTSSTKSSKVKIKLSTDNKRHYPVRILNNYKHDEEGEWEQVDDEDDAYGDDDDDDYFLISPKSYLSSSKNNMEAGNHSICLKQLLAAVSLMSDHFEEIADRLNVETEKRKEAETNVKALSNTCQQMEKEIASLKYEISNLRKKMENDPVDGGESTCSVSKMNWTKHLDGQPKCDDNDGNFPSSTSNPSICSVVNEQNVKNTKLAIPLVAPKQINSPLFQNHLKPSRLECDNSKEKLKEQQLAELNRKKEEKLKELNRILLMEKTAQAQCYET